MLALSTWTWSREKKIVAFGWYQHLPENGPRIPASCSEFEASQEENPEFVLLPQAQAGSVAWGICHFWRFNVPF